MPIFAHLLPKNRKMGMSKDKVACPSSSDCPYKILGGVIVRFVQNSKKAKTDTDRADKK